MIATSSKSPDFKQIPRLLYRCDETPPGFAGPERKGVGIVMASLPVSNSRDRAASGHPDQTLAEQLDRAFQAIDPVARIVLLRDRVEGPLVFTTSFGLEDQALTHFIARSGIDVSFVTLDTGRLFPETYGVWAATEQRYRIQIRGFYPDTVSVESLVKAQGIDGFYSGKAARSACCCVRKVEPLGRALRGAAAWIAGLRADQSATRQSMDFVSYDPARDLLKANPLFDWSRERIAALTAAEGIPVSPLHARGFLSIGCAPCTRAVAQGEPERSGRWWWENEEAKECGLHLTPDGRLVRAGGVS
jgi:phosphoadenosine phosphosulfate reductase